MKVLKLYYFTELYLHYSGLQSKSTQTTNLGIYVNYLLSQDFDISSLDDFSGPNGPRAVLAQKATKIRENNNELSNTAYNIDNKQKDLEGYKENLNTETSKQKNSFEKMKQQRKVLVLYCILFTIIFIGYIYGIMIYKQNPRTIQIMTVFVLLMYSVYGLYSYIRYL